MRRLGLHHAATAALVALLALLGVLTPQDALAASPAPKTQVVRVAGHEYRCRKSTVRISIPAPPASSVLPGGLGETICPAGELPVPRSNSALSPAPPSEPSGDDQGTLQSGGDYFYANEMTGVTDATGLGGYASDQSENLNGDAKAHSDSQLWAVEYEGPAYSDIELGVITGASTNGPSEADLFTFTWDASQPGCYNACGFVQVANQLGYVPGYPLNDAAGLLSVGPAHLYQVYENPAVPGEWWVAIDGVPIGYYPASTWPRQPLTSLNELQVGGEVSANPDDQTPETTMGDGFLGSDASTGHGAPAYWANVQDIVNGAWQTPPLGNSIATNPTPGNYDLGVISGPSFPDDGAGWSFSYGGPGYCLVPSVACNAQAGLPAPPAPPKKHKKKAHHKKRHRKVSRPTRSGR